VAVVPLSLRFGFGCLAPLRPNRMGCTISSSGNCIYNAFKSSNSEYGINRMPLFPMVSTRSTVVLGFVLRALIIWLFRRPLSRSSFIGLAGNQLATYFNTLDLLSKVLGKCNCLGLAPYRSRMTQTARILRAPPDYEF
jgi:hypothetical protein